MPIEGLSYDDTIPYEEQVAPATDNDGNDTSNSLLGRIARNKVYLLSESAAPRASKRKHGEEQVPSEVEEDAMNEDPSLRHNALLLTGLPIAHLPTARLFAYATNFDAHPLGLEWVNDTTCVLVFDSQRDAHDAWAKLARSPNAAPDGEGFHEAQRVPRTFWPAKVLISSSVRPVAEAGEDGTTGENEGGELAAPIRMRYARLDDVKKRGAAKESRFYAKHGNTAGKEVYNPATGRVEVPHEVEDGLGRKRRKVEEGRQSSTAKDLDDDLDAFLAEGSPPPTMEQEPPSKMRSDGYDPDAFVGGGGKTLLERTSMLRAHPELSDESSRRRDGGSSVRKEGRERESARGNSRPKRTLQELDDELDAFLNDR